MDLTGGILGLWAGVMLSYLDREGFLLLYFLLSLFFYLLSSRFCCLLLCYGLSMKSEDREGAYRTSVVLLSWHPVDWQGAICSRANSGEGGG